MSMREDPDCGALLRLPLFPPPILPALAEDRPLHARLLAAGGQFSKARGRFLLAYKLMWVGIPVGFALVIGFVAGALVTAHQLGFTR